MFFLLTIILAIVLYVLDHKVIALLVFFFYLTSGFNLVPEEATEFLFISKGYDFALIMLFTVIGIDAIFVRNYLKPDKLIWLCAIFFVFLAVCVYYNMKSVGVQTVECFRTIRYHFFWLTYLIFRKMTKEKLEQLLKCLFVVTVFCSVLFLLQIVLNETILVETVETIITIFGITIPRFYNQPDMLAFFVFMSIYHNPFKGIPRIITTLILVAALLGAFHRNAWGALIVATFVGYVLQLPRLKRIRVVAVASAAALFMVVFFGYRFVKSRTFIDIQKVAVGNVEETDIDLNDLSESTFAFRVAHLLERNKYLIDHPEARLLGGGLMNETSKLTYSMFDFDVGTVEEFTGDTAQLDTPDITYSVLLIRYGYLGTFLNMLLFVYLAVFFFRHKDNRYGLFSFLFFVFSLVTSFFSWTFTLPITFMLPLITYVIVNKQIKENEP